MVTQDITKKNVSKLEVAWMYPTGDERAYQFNPVIVDNVMYVLAKNSSLVAIDVVTRKELWIHANLRGITNRGINYWQSKDGKDRRLLFALEDTLQAIDARTGKSILSFGKNGVVDLREGLGRDPPTIRRVASSTPGRVFENLMILGSSPGEGYFSAPGHIRAYDVITGELAWTFHTIPQPGEFGYDTWPKDAWKYAGGVNVWGEITVDAKRGIAYLPGVVAHLRLLRRRPHRHESLQRLPAGAGCAHRQAPVALPDGASRPLGLRPDRRAAVDHGAQGRQEDRRRRAGHQAGLRVRVRSRDRRARVADRRAAGAEERRAGRAGLADAAVLDAAAERRGRS